MRSLRAVDYVDSSGSIVQSALAFAKAIVAQLGLGEVLAVDFAGLKGLPSSYFNPILQAVKSCSGLAVIGDQLRFTFDSPAQEQVFNRCLQAVQAEPTVETAR